MHRIIRLAAIAAIVATAASCSHKVAITAHRGFWNCEEAGYAENSIKSLEMAQKNHFWGSEFDVHITSDLVLVVHHDAHIQGKSIHTHNYADFKDYRLKNGEKLPTIDEYLTQGEKGGTVLVFELKPQYDKAHEDYMVDKSIEALKAHGLYDPKKVIFISFSRNICERVAALCPGFTNQYLEMDLTPDEVIAKGVNGIDYHYSAFQKNPEWVKQAHDNKMSVNVWTVNKKEDIQAMAELGVDCITTNEPLLVREILGGKEKK
ncbi:MAG: glycerophosphodiester phosphodiesterase [Bacteroidales bacterium]|nr:glycerophosphodiester phosphodiesterase [Bacteroidales bacterium]